jgi:hypothetical protein
MTTPAAPQDPPRDHSCQTGCGRRVEVVIVRLTDSGVDMFCDTCALAMWMAVAEQLVEEHGAPDGAQTAPVG